MTSSCNASLGRIPSLWKNIRFVPIPRHPVWTCTDYSRRLRDFVFRLYQPKLNKPAYASHSLNPHHKKSFLAFHQIQVSKYILQSSFPTIAATPPHPPDLPFSRGSFELPVHDDVTWYFFVFSLGPARQILESDATGLAVNLLF
jgi:hypothetical protein